MPSNSWHAPRGLTIFAGLLQFLQQICQASLNCTALKPFETKGDFSQRFDRTFSESLSLLRRHMATAQLRTRCPKHMSPINKHLIASNVLRHFVRSISLLCPALILVSYFCRPAIG